MTTIHTNLNNTQMLGATIIQTLWRFYKRKHSMETIAKSVYVNWELNPIGLNPIELNPNRNEDPIMEMLACERYRLGQPRDQRRYSLREDMFRKNVTKYRAI